MTKRILKARTQMVKSMYKYFDEGFSESHRAKLYICTLLDPMFKNYNMWPTRKYVTIRTYTTSNGACSSYVKCGPRLNKTNMFLVCQRGLRVSISCG